MRPAAYVPGGVSFEEISTALAAAPLHEAISGAPGEAISALGFALGIAAGWTRTAGFLLIRSAIWSGEEGALAPRGLAAFGIDLGAVIGVETKSSKEALWAAEQALAVEGAVVVAALADRDVTLTASRRLLLQAERSKSRAFLVRASPSGASASSSAAFTRWRVNAAPSKGAERLLGPPVFQAILLRRRGGVAGMQFDLEWNAYARAFRDITMAGDLAEPAFDGQIAARA